MEKLSISHIAPYLPYGLKCQIDLGQNEIVVTDSWGLKTGSDYPASYYDEGKRYGLMLSQIKPLLRPMSSLYKEIDGEVGIVEIFRMFGIYHENIRVTNCGLKYNDGAEWLLFDWSYSAQSFIDSDGGIYLNMESLTYLFQHHYDVFGLIGQNLAIDLNSISHE